MTASLCFSPLMLLWPSVLTLFCSSTVIVLVTTCFNSHFSHCRHRKSIDYVHPSWQPYCWHRAGHRVSAPHIFWRKEQKNAHSKEWTNEKQHPRKMGAISPILWWEYPHSAKWADRTKLTGTMRGKANREPRTTQAPPSMLLPLSSTASLRSQCSKSKQREKLNA